MLVSKLPPSNLPVGLFSKFGWGDGPGFSPTFGWPWKGGVFETDVDWEVVDWDVVVWVVVVLVFDVEWTNGGENTLDYVKY